MLFLLINRTRAGLTAEQLAELATRAQAFYASVPKDVHLRGEWAAVDRSGNFTLLEAPSMEAVAAMQEPFRGLVDMELVPVIAISGWQSK